MASSLLCAVGPIHRALNGQEAHPYFLYMRYDTPPLIRSRRKVSVSPAGQVKVSDEGS